MGERFKNIIHTNYIVLLIIVILFLQIFYLNTNMTNYDGAQYSLTAREWAKNGINLKSEVFYTFTNYGSLTEHRFNSSILSILPLALFIKIFGFTILSMQAYSFICSVFIILLLRLYVSNLFNKEVSNFAVVIYSLFPVNAYLTCSFLTDSYSNLWILLTLILFYYGYQERKIFNLFLLILSGFLTVFSTFVRQWIPIVFVINLLYLYFYNKKFDIRILYYFLGNILGMISILFIAYSFTGDHLYFINIYKEYGNEISKNHFIENPLFIFQMLLHIDYYSIIFLILPFLALKVILNRDKKELFIIMWIIYISLVFEVIIRIFINLPRYHGYLNILIIPISIFLAIIITKENINKQVAKYIKVSLLLYIILILILKYINYANFNYLYYTNLLSIRKYFFIFSILLSVLILFYFIIKYKRQYSLIIKSMLLFLVIFVLLSLSIFSLHTQLSRSYETSVAIKSVEIIEEKKLLLYNLKNSEEPFQILCTSPTLLLPYYQQILNSNCESVYEIKMVNTIQDFNKEGFFLFANKASSFKWETECFDEFKRFQDALLTNNISLTMIYDFGNYTLWKIK